MRSFVRMSVMRERDSISAHLDDFSGIVIDAHILETFQNAVSGYVVANFSDYVIDPVIYKFALDPIEECTSKRWFGNLQVNYDMADLLIADGRIDFNQLKNPKRAEKFTRDVLEYEEKRIPLLSQETISILSLMEEEQIPEHDPPLCLIPPYFLIEDKSTLDIDINLVKSAVKVTDRPIFAYIALKNDLLYSQQAIKTVISNYSETDVDGYFIWIADFNEAKERMESLILYKQFLADLKSKIGEKEVINMFSGFFSTLLASQGCLDGIVHGVGISESKDPYSPGGSAPTRYYMPILHRMLSVENAQDLAEDESLRCECPVCLSTPIADMSVSQLIEHVLNAKVSERNQVESMSPEDIISMLAEDYEKILSTTDDPSTRKQRVAFSIHLQEWMKALED